MENGPHAVSLIIPFSLPAWQTEKADGDLRDIPGIKTRQAIGPNLIWKSVQKIGPYLIQEGLSSLLGQVVLDEVLGPV